MKTIYLLTAGCYSDFGVICAFTNKDDAKAALEAGLGDNIDECTIDPERETTPAGVKAYRVSMRFDGDKASARQADPYKNKDGKHVLDWPPAAVCDGGGESITFRCWARDEQHAIKICNELRARLIAEDRLKWRKAKVSNIFGQIVEITVADILNDGFKVK
jgi:hypothetical protein